MVILNNEVTCRILEGEEEEKYLAKVVEEMNASKNKYNKSKRGARKGKKSFRKKYDPIINHLAIIMMFCHANTEKSYI